MRGAPARWNEALAWAAEQGFQVRGLQELPGDVSPRRYCRLGLAAGGSVVLALYPDPVREACQRFLRTGRILQRIGVRIPEVLASDCRKGLMLLEDLGDSTLHDLEEIGWPRLRPFFDQAVEMIGRILSLRHEEVRGVNPDLDQPLLLRELQQTWDVLLVPRGLAGSGPAADRLRLALRELCHQLSKPAPFPCHRDFMARNLAVPEAAQGGLALLDHQDLRLGPPLYDLASLLNDSLFAPADLEAELLDELAPEADRRLGYHRAAVQRTLKAAGTFQSFARRGVERHLRLIPPTLERCLYHLQRVPETESLAPSLAELWEPLLAGLAQPGEGRG